MAEGLIPFIYRAIKRRRREQRYNRSFSTRSERWFGLPGHHHKLLQPPAIQLGSISEGASGQVGAAGVHHRRHRSMEDFSSAGEIFPPEGGGPLPAKEMVRFGSSRRVFSCITGANRADK